MLDPSDSGPTPGENVRNDPLRDLVDAYLASKAKANGSGTYRASAESVLGRWCQWMGKRDHGLDELNDADTGPKIMRRYAQYLRQRAQSGDGISASTATTYYAYIRACLSWGVRDGRLERNPALPERATEELPEPTSNRRDQQHWTPEQRAQLLRYVDEHAHAVIDEEGFSPESVQAARDRALVSVLYYAAVRGAEVLRHRRDEREGRQGLRWKNADLDAGKIRIFGKGEQDWTWHPLPGPTVDHLEQLKRVQRPASGDWPVFTSSHAPSKWAAARDALDDVAELVEEYGSIDAVLRESDVAPPALTTEGARSRLRDLTGRAGVDVDGDAEYLQPHGARRGMIGEVFKRDRGEAQDLGRHRDMSTTEDAYRHLDVEEQRDRIDDLLDGIQ